MVDSRQVKVDFFLEDMDLSEFKGKATYEQIKAYVLDQTELKVSSLYIAPIKKTCGLMSVRTSIRLNQRCETATVYTGEGRAIMRHLDIWNHIEWG